MNAGRPQHPDFWLISQAVLDADAQSDSGQSVADIVSRRIDLGSVTYMARQRALLARLRRPGEAVFSALWVDGFIAGMTVQHMKAQITEDES